MTQYLQIDLREQSIRTIKILFNHIARYIYAVTNIRFVQYKSKLYFHMANTWNGGLPPDVTKEETKLLAHKDVCCDGYWEDECEFKPMIKPNTQFLEYIYNYDACESDKYICDDELHPSITNPLKKIHEFVFDSDPNTSDYNKTIATQVSNIVFLMSKPVCIINTSKFNTDHRGSDHIPLKLPFESNVKLGQTFTFKELIDSMYRIKSHKFDSWYELFGGVDEVWFTSKQPTNPNGEVGFGPKQPTNPNGEVNEVASSSQAIEIYVSFDHGS